MPISASSGQQVALPTRDGGPLAISAQFAVSGAGNEFHAAVDISSTNLIAISVARFGTLVSETLTLQISMDNGVSYQDYKTYTFAQLNVAAGAYFVEQVKGTRARVNLRNGQSGIGFVVYFLV